MRSSFFLWCHAFHVKTLCNKPSKFPKMKFFANTVRKQMNGNVMSGFSSTSWFSAIIGKNPKVFDKKFDEKSWFSQKVCIFSWIFKIYYWIPYIKFLLKKKLLNSSKSNKFIKFTIGFPIQKIKISLIWWKSWYFLTSLHSN